MRKESLFTSGQTDTRRVYKSPILRVLKLGATAILAGSVQAGENEKYYEGGALDDNF